MVRRGALGSAHELEWLMQNCSSTSAMNSLLELSFSAAIYHIFGERNATIFRVSMGLRKRFCGLALKICELVCFQGGK